VKMMKLKCRNEGKEIELVLGSCGKYSERWEGRYYTTDMGRKKQCFSFGERKRGPWTISGTLEECAVIEKTSDSVNSREDRAFAGGLCREGVWR